MELSDWFKGFEKGIAKLTAEQREQFKGFEKGIAKLTAEQREQFFSECGKHCVQCGTL